MVTELMNPAGILLRRDVIAAGYDDNALARAVRAAVITRVRQGAYVASHVWGPLDEVGRHHLLSEAVLMQYDDDVALSHASAVVRMGGPSYGLDLTNVHLTHLIKFSGRRNGAGLVHHEGTCRVLDVTRTATHWMTSPPRTVLDVAMFAGLQAGIIVADDFIRRDLTTKAELRAVYECVKDWPGALILRLVIERCDGRAESVGESLGRELFRKHRVPMPLPQFEIFHPNGMLAGRTDWAWPEYKLLGEFDGRSKYARFIRPGETPADALWREKQREDLLRELTGWSFIRLIWADLFLGERTAQRVLAALARAAA
jgi:hypothetical protein